MKKYTPELRGFGVQRCCRELTEDRDGSIRWGVLQRMVPGVMAELDAVFQTLVETPSASLIHYESNTSMVAADVSALS